MAEIRCDARQLPPMRKCKSLHDTFSVRREFDTDPTSIIQLTPAHRKAFLLQAIDQSHGRIVFDEKLTGQFGDGKGTFPGVSFDRREPLVLP